MKTKWNLIFATLLTAFLARAGDEPLDKNSSAIQSWASGVQSISYGSDVASKWKTPNKSLGHAEGTSMDIVCLGQGGQITLSFPHGISNGSGNDFAVFENGISDTFLELGWVEVSTDGIHFVRFPNYSQTQSPVGSFGELDPINLAMLASKYRQGYGTPFDLSAITQCYNNDPYLPTTSTFRANLNANYPYLNMSNIQYIRIVDIVGDGNAKDALGHAIYDPYPTVGSAGFDLDAIAVLHEGTTPPPPPPNTFANWSFLQGLSGMPSDDFDGDDSADLEEYFFGTSPTNSAEKASFSGRALSNQFEIIYLRDPGALGTIDVESIADLTQTNWNIATPDSVTSNAMAEAIEVKVILPITPGHGFYRLRFEQADE